MTIGSTILRAVRTLLGVAVLCGALGLIAFGPRGKSDLAPGRVIVTYWEKWTDFEGEAMRRLCALFNETEGARRGIYVDYVPTTSVDLKTLVATSGGDPPDIAGLWLHNIASFASKDALMPLDAFADESGITAEMFVPVYYDACRYRGHLYSLPSTPWSIALYYNKDILAEFADKLRAAGLDPDRPPRTLDELTAYARVINRRNAQGELTMMTFLPASPETVGWYWNTWGLWAGGAFTDPNTSEMRVDSPEYIRGYGWVREYVDIFGTRDLFRFDASLANFNSPDNPFMSGRLAMMQQGPWFANMIQQYAPKLRFGVAPFPSIDGREVGYCSGDGFMIPAAAKHPREAWAFIEWMYMSGPVLVPSGKKEPQPGYEYYLARSDAGVERRPMRPMKPIEWLCWSHFKNGPLRTPSAAYLETHPNPGIEVHERMARSVHATADPLLPNYMELNAELIVAYRDIWAAGADPAARLHAAQKRLDKLTNLARREQARYGETYP